MKQLKRILLVVVAMGAAAIPLFTNVEHVNAGPTQPQPLTTQFATTTDVTQSGYAYANAISYDGRYVAITTPRALDVTDTNGIDDIYVYDRDSQTFERASLDPSGNQSTDYVSMGAMSSNGRYVAFGAPYNGTNFSILLRDLTNNSTTVVSTTSSGTQCSTNGYLPTSVTDDGVYVTITGGSNMCGVTNGDSYVYVKNMSTNSISTVTTSLLGHTWRIADGILSADGSMYAVRAIDLTTNTNCSCGGSLDRTLAISRSNGNTVIVSDPSSGVANRRADRQTISRNGRFILFNSYSSNLDPVSSRFADGSWPKLMLYDLQTSTQDHIDAPLAGSPNGGTIIHTSNDNLISDDGRYVGFFSKHIWLDSSFSVSGGSGTASSRDSSAFIKDRTTNTFRLIGNQVGSTGYSISGFFAPGKGEFVLSTGVAIDSADTNATGDPYIMYSGLPTDTLTYTKTGTGLRTMKSDGTNDKSLIDHTALANPSSPQISTDRKNIYFVAGSSSNMYSIHPDGMYLKDLGYAAGIFQLSPDGTKIVTTGAYILNTTDHDYYPGIKIMNIDGTSPSTITVPEAGTPAQMAWSKDGNKIVFQLKGKNTDDEWDDCKVWIAKIDTTGSNFTKLSPNDCNKDANPAINPDTGKIAWNPTNATISVMNEDGTSAAALAPATGSTLTYLGRPSWSPDGTKIAADSRDSTNGTNQRIVILNGYTGAQTATGPNATTVTYLDWSSASL